MLYMCTFPLKIDFQFYLLKQNFFLKYCPLPSYGTPENLRPSQRVHPRR